MKASVTLCAILLVALTLILIDNTILKHVDKIVNTPRYLKESKIEDSTPEQPSYKQSMTLEEARSRPLAPLHQYDREYYTVRMNTFRRNEQLLVSLNHYSRCEGVAQIQVVWCDSENDPPEEILNHPSNKVVIERHEENTLNERFHVLVYPPTLGILSVDDDVIRPCEALDAAFFKWTRAPHRMVGYDPRVHEETTEGKWEYKNTPGTSNMYSFSLTKMCFLHRDYLNLYMTAMPTPILSTIAQIFNCEDIAMSFFISSLTNGNPPLLADFWALKTRIQLYSDNSISGNVNHKHHYAVRSACVDRFADLLELKREGPTTLKTATFSMHFQDGLEEEDMLLLPFNEGTDVDVVERHKQLIQKLKLLMHYDDVKYWKKSLLGEAKMEAKQKGLIKYTEQWKKRWNEA